MLVGADTGFFVSLANGHARAREIWQELVEGRVNLAVVSTDEHFGRADAQLQLTVELLK